MTDTYRIVRMFRDYPGKRPVQSTGLTLDEAQAWCRDPQTTSSKETSREADKLTEKWGPWFDGYEQE